MTQRVHPMMAVLVLAIVLVGVMVAYTRRLEETAPKPAPLAEAQGPPLEDPGLGIAWMPDVSSHGYLVSRILPGPPRSRLASIGVKESDVLTGLNGRGGRFELNELKMALRDLDVKGRPFSLTVKRAGEEIVLRPTKSTRAAAEGDGTREPEAAGGDCADGESCAVGGSGSCAEGGGSCSAEEAKAAAKKPTAAGPEPVIGK